MAFVGIDLGTTTSEVAIFQNGKIRVLHDARGNEIIDSYFGVDNKTRQQQVGKRVKDIFMAYPELCVEQVKRQMGKDIEIKVADQYLRPEEISAHILVYLKKAAENVLDEAVDRAVITVPANFPDTARTATKQAGEIAGFKVERIINEPTAAALAYGHSEGMDEEIVMVYDLGGGTFDVSIVEYVGNVLDVQASAGDPHLGGKDFDKALLDHVASRFAEENGLEIEPDSGPYYRLLFACEQAKKELSFNHSVAVHIPFFMVKNGQPVTLDVEVSRAQFERLIAPMVDRTEQSIRKTLKAAEVSEQDISRILLIGGSTRIPYVKQLVERVMGRKPVQDIDPDRAVAMGAAAQAAIIDGASKQIIMDVCPLSLGTSVVVNMGSAMVPGVYSEIIPANEKQLKSKTEEYSTIYENQSSINFRVYQRSSESESKWAEVEGRPNDEDGYTLLRSKEIQVPPGPAGQKVTVTYTYNLNGIIDIVIEVGGTKTTFDAESKLNEQQITASRAKIESMWQASEHYEEVRALLHAAEKEMDKGMDTDAEVELRRLIDKMKVALARNDADQVKQLEEEITDLLFNIS